MTTTRAVKVRRKAPKPPPRDTDTCSCGATTAEHEGGDLIVRGPGWLKESRSIRCGKCPGEIPFAPRVVWETSTGARYSTREYLREGQDRKLR